MLMRMPGTPPLQRFTRDSSELRGDLVTRENQSFYGFQCLLRGSLTILGKSSHLRSRGSAMLMHTGDPQCPNEPCALRPGGPEVLFLRLPLAATPDKSRGLLLDCHSDSRFPAPCKAFRGPEDSRDQRKASLSAEPPHGIQRGRHSSSASFTYSGGRESKIMISCNDLVGPAGKRCIFSRT